MVVAKSGFRSVHRDDVPLVSRFNALTRAQRATLRPDLAWEYTEVMLGIAVRCNSGHLPNACLGRPRILVSLLALLVSLAVTLAPRPGRAQLMGPGKYSGVVIFDRWDSCILFSGVFLM